jgi:hypothetical protein
VKKIKILIANDGYHAHYFERMAWVNAFNSLNFVEAQMYDIKTPAFRVFDAFEPDIFLGQLYNLDVATIKCIQKRPHLKVGLRAGDYGDLETDPRFNILKVTEKELTVLDTLKKETGQPEFVYIHYEPESVKKTHSKFEQMGIKTAGILLCADVHSYIGGVYNDYFGCDIGFVGGYWPYKAQIIDKYLLPLCFPVGKYSVKIFGNQGWNGVNQFCGTINEQDVKDLFVSAKICPNLSEPHAHEYGVEVNERTFKVLAAGGFCISDNVASHKRIFGDGVVFADSPIDFEEKIQYFLGRPEERKLVADKGRKIVLKNHTNYHRVSQILSLFGYEDYSKLVLNSWEDYYAKNLS